MFMRPVVLLSVGLAGLLQNLVFAEGQPQGTVLELHSCELYAGGCIVSSEAVQGGQYMLRVWNFTHGEFAGSELAGLQAGLLQISDQNLAAQNTRGTRAVLYLPESATAEQRAALKQWVLSQANALVKGSVAVRTVPMRLARADDSYRFSAGNYLSVTTAPLASCPTGSCGEALWYSPRTQGGIFTVAVNRSSRVAEPLLKLQWEDGGKKSVFLARFGYMPHSKPLYVSTVELCGVAGGSAF